MLMLLLPLLLALLMLGWEGRGRRWGDGAASELRGEGGRGTLTIAWNRGHGGHGGGGHKRHRGGGEEGRHHGWLDIGFLRCGLDGSLPLGCQRSVHCLQFDCHTAVKQGALRVIPIEHAPPQYGVQGVCADTRTLLAQTGQTDGGRSILEPQSDSVLLCIRQ